MPTDDANLARVMRALLSRADVICEEVDVSYMGFFQKGYNLSVIGSITIDAQHEQSVQSVLKGEPVQ